MPVISETETCNIPDLVADGTNNGIAAFDPVQIQAAILYILALTVKGLDPTKDYTDICALAKSLESYDKLPDYARNAALVEAWSEVSENTTGEELDWDLLKQQIACAHCCGITKQSIQTSQIYLLCLISNLLQPV